MFQKWRPLASCLFRSEFDVFLTDAGDSDEEREYGVSTRPVHKLPIVRDARIRRFRKRMLRVHQEQADCSVP